MFESVKCLILSGTVVDIAFDGVDIQTQTLFETLIGVQFELKFVYENGSVKMLGKQHCARSQPNDSLHGVPGIRLKAMFRWPCPMATLSGQFRLRCRGTYTCSTIQPIGPLRTVVVVWGLSNSSKGIWDLRSSLRHQSRGLMPRATRPDFNSR